MVRAPRKLSDSQNYHVMIYGNNKDGLFVDDEDKQQLLEIIKNNIEQRSTLLIAYCIMKDHAHFLFKEENNISELMKKINISYAIYYNKKYNSAGHVFADRFKSECIKERQQLLSVIRFIHNNPYQCGLSINRIEYKWSSYNEYIQDKKDTIVDKNCILIQFDGEYEKAIKKFIDYNNKENYDIFLDMLDTIENRMIRMVESYLKHHHINLSELGYKENRQHRIYLVVMMKKQGNLSIRKIGEMLQQNRGIVYKIITQYLKN